MNKKNRQMLLASSVIALCGSRGAFCMDVSITGFGTIGYAISDHDFKYLRYIDDRGTFKVDSIAGVQTEIQFDPQWGATVQGVASAPRTRDNGYEAKIRWAFLSYRPSNEWLLRAGRVRPPVFFNTQNAEVGVTYDAARLPAEVYSLSPVYDFDGGAVTKTWSTDAGETNLDVYAGTSDVKYRFHYQTQPLQPYFPEKITVKGVVVSHATGGLLLRSGFHRAKVESKAAEPFFATATPTPIPGAPPIGGVLFVPTGPMREFDANVFTFGADWRSGDWRVTAEYGQRAISDTQFGPDSKGAYVTVTRQLNRWAPYATYARLLSGDGPRSLYSAVNGTPVPLAVQMPPSNVPANFHALMASSISVYDQYSTMLGTSYSFSATSKLKVEWMRTKVGLVSSLVDGVVQDQSFNVLSLSYSVAF